MVWERTVTLGLALMLAAGLAGCIGNAGEAADTASTEETESASDPSADNSAPESQPVDVTRTHDLGGSTNASTQTFQLPPNADPYQLEMYFEPTTLPTSCTAADAEIVLEAPDGEVFESTNAGGSVGIGADCGGQVHRDSVTMPAGDWTVTFDGAGAAEAHVHVAN